jgi:hypothetical protein
VSYVNGRRRRRMREEHEFPIYWPWSMHGITNIHNIRIKSSNCHSGYEGIYFKSILKSILLDWIGMRKDRWRDVSFPVADWLTKKLPLAGLQETVKIISKNLRKTNQSVRHIKSTSFTYDYNGSHKSSTDGIYFQLDSLDYGTYLQGVAAYSRAT